MPSLINLSGSTFGKLTVLIRANAAGRTKWVCLCACGDTSVVDSNKLQSGHTKSCGCLKRTGDAHKTHGASHSTEYNIWKQMRYRCSNPENADFYLYGERGIRVCDRWGKFENFLKDMGERPVGYSLDRIDVNGNYCPINCRWVPLRNQSGNRRPYTQWRKRI